jgi:hypothetical protein
MLDYRGTIPKKKTTGEQFGFANIIIYFAQTQTFTFCTKLVHMPNMIILTFAIEFIHTNSFD